MAEKFGCEDDIIECWDQMFMDHEDKAICYCQVSFHPDIIDLSIVVNHK
jgi:hypothetical protein